VRIVFVLAGLGAGGAEKIVNLLADHRRYHGDEVFVVALNAPTAQSYFAFDDEIRVETIGTDHPGNKVGSFLSRVRKLRKRIREIQPDIVISFLTKVNALVGLAMLGSSTPRIMSERNNYLRQDLGVFWQVIGVFASRGADCIVMQTDHAYRQLSRSTRSKAVVIPNPVPPLARPPLNEEPMRFVAVGRLDRQKGFDLLLEAFAAVAKRLPGVTLTIFGEGPQRQALEAQVQALGISDRVRLPGVTKDPVEWIVNGDMFVLSSRFEGFPNVLVEALKAGLPSIAFDCPWGPAEILGEEGASALVPAEDVGELAVALERIAKDREYRHGLAEAGPRIVDRFSTSSVFSMWDRVIDGTAGNAAAKGATAA